ncbi:4073_t:CDS:2 [Gigaspora rosea]|nr:4073_t:CDS:2 [Gigaspora rosea]
MKVRKMGDNSINIDLNCLALGRPYYFYRIRVFNGNYVKHNNNSDSGQLTTRINPSGNGQLIASDVTIFPNANHVQQSHIPYPGPPPGDRNGRPHARIVCEVGNIQSTKEWNNKCQLWMNQIYIRYVLGIKLHKKRNRKNTLGQYHRSMMARLWQQGAGYQEFETIIRKKQTPTNCNAPNLPQYQVIIPIAQVFWDPVLPLPPADGYVPTVPIPLATATAPVNFIIDLYRVQQLVLNKQDNT